MNLRNIVETTQHTADTLSGEVVQAVICVPWSARRPRRGASWRWCWEVGRED